MLEHRSMKRLIDFLFLPSTHIMPNERVFAESLLMRDLGGVPEDVLARLASRLAGAVEVAPRLAVKLASCRRLKISLPLLHTAALEETDLVEIAEYGYEQEQLVIANRGNLSPVVSDLLVRIGGDQVVKALLMNGRIRLSVKTLDVLIPNIRSNIQLLSALLARPELSAPMAMDLFWYVPDAMREFILTTHLCNRRALTGFLHEDSAWRENQKTLCASKISDERLKTITKLMVGNEREKAIAHLAENARLPHDTAAKILNDKGGEAFLVAAKAMGASRAGLNESLMRFINTKPSIIGSTKRLEPMRSLFDRISRDQAMVALQYWVWESEKLLADTDVPTSQQKDFAIFPKNNTADNPPA